MEGTLIYPHQLFDQHPALAKGRKVYFIEEPLLYGKDKHWPLKHHARRQALIKEAGDRYLEVLLGEGYELEVISLGVELSTSREMLDQLPGGLEKVVLCKVVDDLLERRLEQWAEDKGVTLDWVDSPNFLTPEAWWRNYFQGKVKPFMAHFYKAQRKRLGILLDDEGEPAGGRWSFDEENRKKLPKDYQQPELPEQKPFDQSTKSWVARLFPDAWGTANGNQGLPRTHHEAEAWLEVFLQERFETFGDYEDAISSRFATQQHSVLTPMLNIGLLDPVKVVDRALEYGEAYQVPLNSVEGFVRQVIGWREFMRCMYELYGRKMRMENFWGFEHEMPRCFYTGRSGLPPVDNAVRRVLETGYAHHIERLMVFGVIFQLCHVKPTSVYQWFMELFVDAYDWVMVPNVYGMSQFADGGKFVTKPYVCGSNYIRKMSDYPKGGWCEIWDALFWDYIAANRSFYAEQPRLGMMVRQLDRMGEVKLEGHRKLAREYRERIHRGWECEEELF
ncbi:deoxyribodipyrimidine photolyase-related protein [Rubritalea squalenifaciens DSM 18772]|uniref:Deoxyribodipyrimidine photolyase-related protein n=1 Tax=Rubritalea squalenifaciens DSM 18772 TaxID=1123071 RepID=A0A1M6P1G3_9BACT|nr:cryptochrome/photolyase family protein [Rubritalea squalenifaciens]SHK01744.1 deoxyribodipyrimidine photolyase-related protein [Rubritalea squalenifaciens DSM 18772]